MHLLSSFIPVSSAVPSALVEWHQRLNGQEFEQALGSGEDGEPGMLQSRGHRESDVIEQ